MIRRLILRMLGVRPTLRLRPTPSTTYGRSFTPDQRKRELIEEAFRQTGFGFGSIRIECGCGRVHFATGDPGADWDDGELEQLLAQAKQYPHKYIEQSYDAISSVEFQGRPFVWDCPCDWELRLFNLLTEHRKMALEFYRQHALFLAEQSLAANQAAAALGAL